MSRAILRRSVLEVLLETLVVHRLAIEMDHLCSDEKDDHLRVVVLE